MVVAHFRLYWSPWKKRALNKDEVKYSNFKAYEKKKKKATLIVKR